LVFNSYFYFCYSNENIFLKLDQKTKKEKYKKKEKKETNITEKSQEKSFEEKLKEKEIKYKNKYENINENENTNITTRNKNQTRLIKLHEDNYFTNLKKEIESEKLQEKSKKEIFEENRKKRQREFYKDIKDKGDNYEELVGKHYEERGYTVIYHGLKKGLKDEGIDLICNDDNCIILIQCKNYSKEKSIDHVKIKEFHSNAMIYIEKNNIDKNRISLKYIVPNKKVFDNSAIRIFRDKFYNCRYEII